MKRKFIARSVELWPMASGVATLPTSIRGPPASYLGPETESVVLNSSIVFCCFSAVIFLKIRSSSFCCWHVTISTINSIREKKVTTHSEAEQHHLFLNIQKYISKFQKDLKILEIANDVYYSLRPKISDVNLSKFVCIMY
jgi:hypothetical protein